MDKFSVSELYPFFNTNIYYQRIVFPLKISLCVKCITDQSISAPYDDRYQLDFFQSLYGKHRLTYGNIIKMKHWRTTTTTFCDTSTI